MKVLVLSLCIAISIFVVSGFTLKNEVGPSVVEGNCTNASLTDLVFSDHVYKNALPLLKRTEIKNYSGKKTIYCIQALNQQSKETGGIAIIKRGGVNQTKVTIELESERGHGIDFLVYIFARNATRSRAPMTLGLDEI